MAVQQQLWRLTQLQWRRMMQTQSSFWDNGLS